MTDADEDRDAEQASDEDNDVTPDSEEDRDAEPEVEVSFGPDGAPSVETGVDGDPVPSSSVEADESSSGDASGDPAPNEQATEGDDSTTVREGDDSTTVREGDDSPSEDGDADSVDGGDPDDTPRDDPSRGPFVEDLAAEVREEYDTVPDDEVDDPPDIFADRRSTSDEGASGDRTSGDAEPLDDGPPDDTTASNETADDPFAEQSADGALGDRSEEDGRRRVPLSELADEVRRDAEAVDPDDDPLFEPAGTDDAGPSGWDRLERESEEFSQPDAEPAAEAVDEVGQEHVVDKRQYCQQCPHLADPPELGCTHEGTEIVEVTDAEHFRVRACPVIGEDGPNFDAVDDS
ncbi:hypothetical protein RYH80_14245 [Halobaculum sp. MBLA0147]|uniref:hypothetical protein n=1 Tax=Halobaculum sp. MBLA0147 TaxID=3079934 RepID=UPI0035233ADA